MRRSALTIRRAWASAAGQAGFGGAISVGVRRPDRYRC